MRKSKLYRKVFNFLIKVTISILLLVVINNYLFGKDALLQSINAYKEADSTSHPVYMIILIGLMPLNWFLEMLKWRSVLQTQKRITLSESFYAVMSGVTLGVITPARVGEYVGRSLYVDKNDKHLTYIGTLLCSISQNLINITLGLLACSVYISTFNVSFNLNLLVLINSLIVVLGLAIYFNVFKVIDFLKRYTFFRKLFLNSSVIEVSNKVLLKILLWASLRYGIYLLQFILALKFSKRNHTYSFLITAKEYKKII